MTKPGPSVTSGADTQPGSDSLFPSGFGGGAAIRTGGVGTGEIADGSVAAADLNLPSVAAALAARSELTGTYAGLGNSRPAAGLLWWFGGDSITNGSAASNFAYAFAPQSLTMVGGMVGRFDSIEAGTAGETSAQLLSRTAASLAQYQPAASVVMIGTNDAGQAVPLATTVANITAIVKLCKAYGPVVLCTIPPRGNGATSAIKTATGAINTWVRNFAPSLGVEVADASAVLLDTTTGDMASTYNSGDDTHPNSLGHQVMAPVVAKAMKRASMQVTPTGLVRSVTSANLITDPLVVGGTVRPSGFFEWAGGTGTAPTYSLVSDTSGVLPAGRWCQMDFDATASGGQRRLSTAGLTTGYSAGDVLIHTAHLQIEDVTGTWQADMAANTAGLSMQLVNQSAVTLTGSSAIQRCAGIQDPTTGFWNIGPVVWPSVVPAGTTTINGWYALTLPTGKRVKFRSGCYGIINATTLGIASLYNWASSMVNT